MDATNGKGDSALHKLVQSWKDSKMLVRLFWVQPWADLDLLGLIVGELLVLLF